MIAAISRAYFKKTTQSTSHAMIIAIAVFVNIAVWFIEQMVSIEFEMLSISYIISELFLLSIHHIVTENRQLKGIRKNLRFRKGVASDLERIMELVADAQNWFRGQNIDQWQDGYPTENVISSDIQDNVNYIIEYNGVAVATAVISFTGEPTYMEIEGKGWLNNNPYAVVHRIAVADRCRRKGIAKEILYYVEELCAERGVADIRIDTHRDNAPMRSLLKKMGYTHCGRITLISGAYREAYQKIL